MKILHVITDLRLGGAERALCELARASAARGDKVEVIALKQLGPMADELRRVGIACLALGAPDEPGLGTLRASLHLAATIKTNPPDLVHAWLASGSAAVKVALPPAIPRVYGLRVTDVPGLGVRALLAADDGAPHAWVAVSEAVAMAWSTALPIPRVDVTVIPNGIDAALKIAPEPDGAHPCFLGRLAVQKGVDVLLRAIAETDLVVDIYGDGPALHELRAQAAAFGVADRAVFHGVTGDPRAVLRRASMLVLPSRAEGMSNAVLEAMAEGRAVVATDIPGMREVVEPGKTGLLVPGENPVALARALTTLQDEPARRRTLGKNGHARARADFQPAALHERMFAVYAGLR